MIAHVTNDTKPFKSPVHKAAAKAGADLIRIEIPTTGAEPAANSIWRTDWTVSLLEWIVGLKLGLIKVNRTPDEMKLKWPAGLNGLSDHAIACQFGDSQEATRTTMVRNGGINLKPGCAVVAAQTR